MLADLAASGEPVPEPLSERTYSGRFVVCVPLAGILTHNRSPFSVTGAERRRPALPEVGSAGRPGGQSSNCTGPKLRLRTLPAPGMVRLIRTVLSPQPWKDGIAKVAWSGPPSASE
jgi:hypothetical protein